MNLFHVFASHKCYYQRLVRMLFTVIALFSCSLVQAQEVDHNQLLSSSEIIEKLKKGGYTVYFRHASTDHLTKDQTPFNADDCSTQRNLSKKGRREAIQIGEGFRDNAIPVGNVQSSPYCRCKDTANLAFGKFKVNNDLHFAINASPQQRKLLTVKLREMLGTQPAEGTNNIIVSHTANLREAAKIWPKPEGVAWVIKPSADGSFKAVGKMEPNDWLIK